MDQGNKSKGMEKVKESGAQFGSSPSTAFTRVNCKPSVTRPSFPKQGSHMPSSNYPLPFQSSSLFPEATPPIPLFQTPPWSSILSYQPSHPKQSMPTLPALPGPPQPSHPSSKRYKQSIENDKVKAPRPANNPLVQVHGDSRMLLKPSDPKGMLKHNQSRKASSIAKLPPLKKDEKRVQQQVQVQKVHEAFGANQGLQHSQSAENSVETQQSTSKAWTKAVGGVSKKRRLSYSVNKPKKLSKISCQQSVARADLDKLMKEMMEEMHVEFKALKREMDLQRKQMIQDMKESIQMLNNVTEQLSHVIQAYVMFPATMMPYNTQSPAYPLQYAPFHSTAPYVHHPVSPMCPPPGQQQYQRDLTNNMLNLINSVRDSKLIPSCEPSGEHGADRKTDAGSGEEQ